MPTVYTAAEIPEPNATLTAIWLPTVAAVLWLIQAVAGSVAVAGQH